MAFFDPIIAPIVVVASNSQKAWDLLHTSFANKIQTRIFSLRDQLTKVSKELKCVTECLRDIWSFSDELATAGMPIFNEELITKILSGLGLEFREISSAIHARDIPISYKELFDKLFDH
ncbi:hypothetical protein ACH5RR_028535 [Cinchona calisaya]|uniref:Uncharacterized protein n=1 Tax=Cinchona calisaya TaxID=153742 RepID=A0ABD2YQY8_9GENT